MQRSPELLTTYYLQSLRLAAREEIDKLLPHISLQKLERLLGLSHGYLSRLRSCARVAEMGRPSPATPSQTLVCTLALIAADPMQRLPELQQLTAHLPDREDGSLRTTPHSPSTFAASPKKEKGVKDR